MVCIRGNAPTYPMARNDHTDDVREELGVDDDGFCTLQVRAKRGDDTRDQDRVTATLGRNSVEEVADDYDQFMALFGRAADDTRSVGNEDESGEDDPEVITDGGLVAEGPTVETDTGEDRFEVRGDRRIVHESGDWTLAVTRNGCVTAGGVAEDYGRTPGVTTRGESWAPKGRTHNYGKSIEQVLARYAHETRFDRVPSKGEHGAALRRGIIAALCELAPESVPNDTSADPLTGVIHVNAPTGPSTHLASEDTTRTGGYATFYPFESAGEQ